MRISDERVKARSPAILTAIFFAGVIVVQAVLWAALPNRSIGGVTLIFIVWPALLVWTCAFYLFIRFARRSSVRFLIANLALMTLLVIAIYPQDSSLGFAGKIQAIAAWIL